MHTYTCASINVYDIHAARYAAPAPAYNGATYIRKCLLNNKAHPKLAALSGHLHMALWAPLVPYG